MAVFLPSGGRWMTGSLSLKMPPGSFSLAPFPPDNSFLRGLLKSQQALGDPRASHLLCLDHSRGPYRAGQCSAPLNFLWANHKETG